jgi:hypothetical protein
MRAAGVAERRLCLEETVGYINRYLQQDYRDKHRSVWMCIALNSQYPALAEAVAAGAALPLVLAGGR